MDMKVQKKSISDKTLSQKEKKGNDDIKNKMASGTRGSISDKTNSQKENKINDYVKNNIGSRTRGSISDMTLSQKENKINDDIKNKMASRTTGSISDKTLSQKEDKIIDDIKKKMASRTKGSISDRTLLPKQKNNKDYNNRFLIEINVFGSPGPIRFIVYEEDTAAQVIQTALKQYVRMERFPILGSNINNFFLYPINVEFDALEPSEAIGSRGTRNFVLCKKEGEPHTTEGSSQIIDRKGSGWRAWIQKSLSLKILSQ